MCMWTLPQKLELPIEKEMEKLRHVKVGMLWIQESVVEEEIILRNVKRENNVVDILTKNFGVATLQKSFPLGWAE